MIGIIVIKLNRIGQLVTVDKEIWKFICLTYLHYILSALKWETLTFKR